MEEWEEGSCVSLPLRSALVRDWREKTTSKKNGIFPFRDAWGSGLPFYANKKKRNKIRPSETALRIEGKKKTNMWRGGPVESRYTEFRYPFPEYNTMCFFFLSPSNRRFRWGKRTKKEKWRLPGEQPVPEIANTNARKEEIDREMGTEDDSKTIKKVKRRGRLLTGNESCTMRSKGEVQRVTSIKEREVVYPSKVFGWNTVLLRNCPFARNRPQENARGRALSLGKGGQLCNITWSF